MAVNLNGGLHGLRQIDANKTVLLLKLTDSALKCLERYQDKPGDKSCKPLMEFNRNQGVIKIPAPKDEERQWQAFTFQLASLNQSAGFDCLQQNLNQSIDCLGSINHKATVNATDDSYNETRIRMTKAKEEEQKNSTKVIKDPNAKLRNRFSKRPSHRKLVEKHHNTNSPETRGPTPPISRLTPTIGLNRSISPLLPPSQEGNSSSKVGVTFRNKTKPIMTLTGGSSTNNNIASIANTSQERIRKPEVLQLDTRKRPSSSPQVDPGYTNPVSKKQRVSHFKKTSPINPSPPENPATDFDNNKLRNKSVSPVKVKPGISFGVTKLPQATDKLSMATAKPSRDLKKSATDEVKEHHTKKEELKIGKSSQKLLIKDDNKDYLKKYTVIETMEQRNEYKKDFNAEFEEYHLYHEKVLDVCEQFRKYRERMSNCEKGTEKYKQIAKQVHNEYKKIKVNNAYKQNRARLYYLHQKLEHIKRLVLAFDQARLAKESLSQS